MKKFHRFVKLCVITEGGFIELTLKTENDGGRITEGPIWCEMVWKFGVAC